jgi:hypothetical protein
MRLSWPTGLVLLAGAIVFMKAQTSQTSAVAPKSASRAFDDAVLPVLEQSCLRCHSAQIASGGLNLESLKNADSLPSHRDEWRMVLLRLKAGEMPPPSVPRPAGLDRMISYLDGQFDMLDRNTQVDPGRITARHLNRAEYRNTVRDLLGVDFQTAQEFPVDDSGEGFDNIGDILSVSPLLAEKYLSAAERIAARALGLVKLPPEPLSNSYADDEHYSEVVGITGNSGSAHSAGTGFMEVTHRVDYDGDYVIQAGLAGQRGADAKPVEMGFWMDGKLLHSEMVETTPPKTVYFGAYERKEFKVFLPEGVHTFRLGFANDAYGAALPKDKVFNLKANKYPQLIGFLGPEPAAEDPAGRKAILICDPNSGQACIDRILSTLAHRAYRRPVSEKDVAPLRNLVATAQREGLSLQQGIATAIQAVLVSPDFLFRIERDPRDAPPIRRVSDIELASRLSYFLWSSMPDDELLGLAEAGKLSDPKTLQAQVKRLLADARSGALVDNFAGQWLELRNLDSVKPDPDKFPEWGPELREAMRTETRMFFDNILRENRPISDFLDARYTFLNEQLAKFYGIDGVTGPDFRRVDLTADQRGGILSQASVLTVSSYPSRTSVVIRGKYVLENILGSPPPPPPANVPALDEDSVGTSVSLRQQMERHRQDEPCASCHSKMDPLGFALENYNAIGKWRTMDGKFPVDSTGTMPDGTTFAGPADMRQAMMHRLPQFAQCLTSKMMEYALGRGIGPSDQREIASITHNWETEGYRFQTLIFEIVNSVPFQNRRAEAAKETGK